jgi:hypothetical protein
MHHASITDLKMSFFIDKVKTSAVPYKGGYMIQEAWNCMSTLQAEGPENRLE